MDYYRPSTAALIATAALILSRTVLAQDAVPSDRNAVNTAARPGGMLADSPVAFPQEGALPAKFPPDVRELSEPAEDGYYIFSSPCRSLTQIATIQEAMPKGEFTPPPPQWTYLPAKEGEGLPGQIVFTGLQPASGSKVQLLGVQQPLSWQTKDTGQTTVALPASVVKSPPCQHAFVIMFSLPEANQGE